MLRFLVAASHVGSEVPAVTADMVVLFGIIAVALVLFVTEPVPIDITAIGVLVALILLEPWTGIGVRDGLSGFSSPATITVLAMFVLSEGIRRTGVVSVIGRRITDAYGDDPFKQMVALIGISGGTAGFINNTPVVAVMIPMVAELTQRTGISPSKLLMPVSFAAMMGGMLTLIGTSTNLLASDVYDQMGPDFEPFSMFEFTALGLLVLLVGSAYLLFIGHRLIPERIRSREPLTEEFEMTEYLTEVEVLAGSPFVGLTVPECLAEIDVDADIVQLVRDHRSFIEPLRGVVVQPGDVLVLRAEREDLVSIIEAEGLGLAPDAGSLVSDDTLTAAEPAIEDRVEQRLVEIVLAPDSSLIGQTLETANFRRQFGASVLAIRRGEALIHARMDERTLRGGDTLLVQGTDDVVTRFIQDRGFVVAQDFRLPAYRKEKLPIALGIVVVVVALAGSGLVPIVVSAVGGIIAMIATGCLRPDEVYDAVDWSVIFLLAGLIPLGLAMDRTGAAEVLAFGILAGVGGAGPVLLIGVFYILTAILTNLISNNASVVLMIPVSVDAAVALGADPFAFAIAVTFAASTAFMTPIGYHTNLMVYAPGGYTFTDFTRVGGPLQVLLAVVTTIGIVVIWGVTP